MPVICSVGETDWKAELEAFGKGVKDDASEVQRHAHKAAKDGASRLEHLPQQAATARIPRIDPERVKTQFDQVILLPISVRPQRCHPYCTVPPNQLGTGKVMLIQKLLFVGAKLAVGWTFLGWASMFLPSASSIAVSPSPMRPIIVVIRWGQELAS